MVTQYMGICVSHGQFMLWVHITRMFFLRATGAHFTKEILCKKSLSVNDIFKQGFYSLLPLLAANQKQFLKIHVYTLWPSDATWRHGSGSTLAQVMACCLTTPSHCLNQC